VECQLLSKVKVTGRQKLQKIGVVFTYGRRVRRKRIRRRLQTRPAPLLGLIYCRRLNPRQLDGRPHVMSALDFLVFLRHRLRVFRFGILWNRGLQLSISAYDVFRSRSAVETICAFSHDRLSIMRDRALLVDRKTSSDILRVIVLPTHLVVLLGR